MRHRVVIVGGGTAGISVAARLRRAGEDDVVVVEPSATHAYQPLWTLVGGGYASARKSIRSEASVMPQGVRWIPDSAVEIDPGNRSVGLASGGRLSYGFLVVCPGLELAWDAVPGVAEAIRRPEVSSNYEAQLAEKTWRTVRAFRGGTAVFAMPGTPIKCPGAPQKAAYLSCDHWRRTGVLERSRVVFATGAGGIFGVPEFAAVLEQVVQRYGIETWFSSELVEVDPDAKEAVFEKATPKGKVRETIPYDLLHVAPLQRAPAFVREGPLADPATPLGWAKADRHTLQNPDFPEIFVLGDAANTPNSKTGAAIRKQAPVVATNLAAAMADRELPAHYDGYAACPFTTARGRMVLAEFDYSMSPHPTIPFIDTQRERYDMWLLKRYGLPVFYWQLMLRGLA